MNVFEEAALDEAQQKWSLAAVTRADQYKFEQGIGLGAAECWAAALGGKLTSMRAFASADILGDSLAHGIQWLIVTDIPERAK